MEILRWEFALGVLEVGDVNGSHRGREDDDEGEGGVLGAGLVAQPPELHRLHLLVTHLHDELLHGGLEPDVHQEPDVSAGGAPLSNINSLFPWETLVKFYSCFCNLMEECSSESLDINISASFGSDILHRVPEKKHHELVNVSSPPCFLITGGARSCGPAGGPWPDPPGRGWRGG